MSLTRRGLDRQQSIEEEHTEWSETDYDYVVENLEEWVVDSFKKGKSVAWIRSHMETDRQLKRQGPGEITHIIEHGKILAAKEYTREVGRVQRVHREIQSGKPVSSKVVLGLSQYERESQRLAESLDLNLYYRDEKGRFTLQPTDKPVQLFRDPHTGRFQSIKKLAEKK
jgi:hypothetical protein